MHVHSPQVDQDLVVPLVLFHMHMQFCIYALYGGSIQSVVHLYVLVYTGSGKGHP